MSVDCTDGEPVENYQSGVRRANKSRDCGACSGPIERGHLYHRTSYKYEDRFYEHDRCARCQAMYEFLRPCVRELGDEEAVDQDLQCGHEWKDNFDGEPPLAVQALAFLTPAEAQVLISKKPEFVHRGGEHGPVSGPIEAEHVRIARLLEQILGARFPDARVPFEAVPREDRDY